MWTHFWDMHSGGGQKEKYTDIYIEAPEEQAKAVFFSKFGHNPERVTCTCCGEDYAIDEEESLQQLTGFKRGCRFAYIETETGREVPKDVAWVPMVGAKAGTKGVYLEEQDDEWSDDGYVSLKTYLKRKEVLVIYAKDIKDEERSADVPEQGFVWQD